MVEEACLCHGLPAHDHPVEWVTIDGMMVARRRWDDYHFWVDWRAIAKALMTEDD